MLFQHEEVEKRPSYIDIDLKALEHNFHTINDFVRPAHVMPILKGNAYGHGMIACGQHLEKVGAQWFGVALLEEGIALRKAGIRIPIVVLGGILHRQIELFLKYDLDINAASINKLEAIEQQAKSMRIRARVHLEIDTGLERTGIHYYNAHQLLEAASKTKWCDIVGIFSHFATGEDENRDFAQLQLTRFHESLSSLPSLTLPQPLLHMAASGTILHMKESHLDLVRPGLIMYGIAPQHHLSGRLNLKPVMSMKSRVVYFKVVKQGTGVSYGLNWKAPQDTRIVTVALGYGDGYNRKFTSSHVLIRGKKYPIVGNICMDQFMVDIGLDEVYNDEEVVLLGHQGDECITIEDLMNKVQDGNAREITTSFGARLPRRYIINKPHTI